MPDPQSAAGRRAGQPRGDRGAGHRAAGVTGAALRGRGAQRHRAATCDRPTEPVADGIDVTRAEFEYAVTHEGALDVDDILDRRTRIGLVARDRERVVPVATEFLARVG